MTSACLAVLTLDTNLRHFKCIFTTNVSLQQSDILYLAHCIDITNKF